MYPLFEHRVGKLESRIDGLQEKGWGGVGGYDDKLSVCVGKQHNMNLYQNCIGHKGRANCLLCHKSRKWTSTASKCGSIGGHGL